MSNDPPSTVAFLQRLANFQDDQLRLGDRISQDGQVRTQWVFHRLDACLDLPVPEDHIERAKEYIANFLDSIS